MAAADDIAHALHQLKRSGASLGVVGLATEAGVPIYPVGSEVGSPAQIRAGDGG